MKKIKLVLCTIFFFGSLILGNAFCYGPTVKTLVLKHYYYSWSYNTDGTNAWGENDIKSYHKPTPKEIIKRDHWLFKGFTLSKIKIDIREVTDDELNEILSPESQKVKSQAAYYRAINK